MLPNMQLCMYVWKRVCVCKRISLLEILGEKGNSTLLVLIWVWLTRPAQGLASVFPPSAQAGKGDFIRHSPLSGTPESHVIPTADSGKPWFQVKSLLPGDEHEPGKVSALGQWCLLGLIACRCWREQGTGWESVHTNRKTNEVKGQQ